jgi:hypothetical protein
MAATDSMIAGLFQDPQQYQQQMLQQQMKQNYEIAQMTPEQQVTGGLRTAGYQLGQGLGGMMGVEDPQMKLMAMRKQVLQGIDPTDAASINKAAQALAQAGDQQGAMQLAQKAQEVAKSGADTTLKLAQAKKAENFQLSQADAEKKRNIIATVEDKLARGETVDPVEINKAKLAFGDISRPKTFQQPGGEIVTVPPTVDASMFPNIGKYMSSGTVGGGNKVAGVIETPASLAAKENKVATAETSIANIDDSLNAVKGIRDLRAGSITTNPWLVRFAKDYPSAAMAQDDLVKTITAGKVIDTIAEMKAQSKTGATGFGALTGRELDQLEAKARRLNPSSPTFEADLKYIEDKLIDSKSKIQSELSKKKTPAPNANNAAGTEGRIAILQQEYATAVKQGNQANIAGLTRELAALGAKPSTTGAQSKYTPEQKIQMTLKASGLEDTPKNRESVVRKLTAEKHL